MRDTKNRIAFITQVLNADGRDNIYKNIEAVRLVGQFLVTDVEDPRQSFEELVEKVEIVLA